MTITFTSYLLPYVMKCEEMFSSRQCQTNPDACLCTVTSYKVSSELFAQTHSTMMKHLPRKKVMAAYHSEDSQFCSYNHNACEAFYLVLCISSKHEKLLILH